MKNGKLSGSRIGVFGKGGAGKSTLTAMLAQVLAQEGYRVCVLDGDSTNFGLPKALGVETPRQSLLEYFGGMVFSGGQVTCPVDDPTPLEGAAINLDELSPDYFSKNEGGIILLTAGKIGRLGPGAGCDGPVAKIARDFELVNHKGDFLTLIDYKAGFEDSARGGLTRLDFALVVVDPTTASVEIASDMLHMIEQIKQGALPATAHLDNPEMVAVANTYYAEARIKAAYFVLNQLPDPETGALLGQKLAQKGIQPTAAVRLDAKVQKAWLKGESVEIGLAEQEIIKIVRALERSC